MSPRLKRPSAAMVVAGTALAVAVGGGTAFAASSALPANSVNTKQLVNQAVTYQKLADGQVGVNKLSPYVQQMLSEKGATGPQGPKGAQGPQGPAGKDSSATTPVTSLGSTWDSHSGSDNTGGNGSASIDAKGAELGNITTSDGYAGISTDSLNGLTPADLSTISYTGSYTGDGANAAPYFKLKLTDAAGNCGKDDVLYAPDAQAPTLSYPGETETFDVTAPYSTVGVHGDDAQPTDGNYATAIHSTTGGANESNESICLAEIIFDGGSGAIGGTATISNVSFAGNGIKPVTYQFGTGQ